MKDKAKRKKRTLKLTSCPLSTKKQILETLERDVFSLEEFQQHVKESAIINETHESVAMDIIKDYLFDVLKLALTKERREPLTIHLTGFLKIEIKTKYDIPNKINY